MSFDFFNEGIKKQPGAEFTKQEQDFLNSKLTFLDPKKTTNISIGTVVQLFNLTRINSAVIKKILQNCKAEGKKTLTYDEMKKVFRGISLAQKGIEPSSINIHANIKLPMPKFYDDDDDDEQEEEPVKPNPVKQLKPVQPPPPPPKSPTNNTQIQASFAEFGQFAQPQKVAQQPQKQEPPKQQPPPQKPAPVVQQQDVSNNKLKEFEAYWSRLHTNNNKIDGGEVKNLCKNLAQRSNLSKAWKLCCHTHSGSLTKGQFYVFLEIVSSHQLPQALTEQMKAMISKIDKGNQNVKEKEKDRNVSQFSQLGSTQVFDNFGKSQLSITAPPLNPQRPTNQPPPSQKPVSNTLIAQTTSRLSGKLQAASKSLQASQQTSQQQLLQLRRQQQAMNNMMGEVEQFLLQVNNKSNKMRTQIDELKNNQTTLNERFNKVCMAMNQVILRQNSLIEELVHQLAQQNHINEQKAVVLEKYVEEREAHCQQMEACFPYEHSNKQEQGNRDRNTPSVNKVEVEHAEEHEDHHYENEYKRQPEVQERVSSPSPKRVASPEQVRQPEQQHEVEQHYQPSPQANQPQAKHPQEQLNKEQQQYMNRMRMKQMQVIQLIHYLTPISQEEYPKIAQKITAYTQDQLNFAYSGLYEKLLEKQRLQQQAVEKPSQKGRSSVTGEDQFNTSNFKHGEKPEYSQGGEDFFS